MALLKLGELLQQIQIGAERRCLDFKEDIDLVGGDRKTKAAVTKDIIAMANAGGGYLVLGVSERSPDAVEISGMSERHLEQFDSTPINGFVSNYVRPRINAICRKVIIGRATVGVVEVPGLYDTPHIVVKDFEGVLRVGDVLVRSANNASERATPEDLDGMLNHCLRNRRDLLQSIMKAGEVAQDSLEQQLRDAGGRRFVKPRFDVDQHIASHVAFLVGTVFWAWGHEAQEIPLQQLHQYLDACAIRSADHSGVYFPPGYSGAWANEERHAGEVVISGPIGYIGGLGYTALTTEYLITMAESIYPRSAYRTPILPDGVEPILLEQITKFVLGAVVFARRLQLKAGGQQQPRIEIQLISSRPLQIVAPDLSIGMLLGVRNIKPNPMIEPICVGSLVKGAASKEDLFDVASQLLQDILWRLYLDLEPGIVRRLVQEYAQKLDLHQESVAS